MPTPGKSLGAIFRSPSFSRTVVIGLVATRSGHATEDHTLLLDCANVEIASSEMLAKLISLQRRLKRKAGRLVLCGVRAGLRNVLTRTHLDQLFEIQEAPEEESAMLDVCVSPRCKEPLAVLECVGSY